MKKRILKAISNTADECEMGMYIKEYEAKTILPDNQPNKLIPEIKIIRNSSDSFLLMILKNFDFTVFMIAFICQC